MHKLLTKYKQTRVEHGGVLAADSGRKQQRVSRPLSLPFCLSGSVLPFPYYCTAVYILPFPCFLPFTAAFSCFQVSMLFLFYYCAITVSLLCSHRVTETKHYFLTHTVHVHMYMVCAHTGIIDIIPWGLMKSEGLVLELVGNPLHNVIDWGPTYIHIHTYILIMYT